MHSRPTELGARHTVNIEPESQAALARQAAAQGIGIEIYAARLLEQAVHERDEAFAPQPPETMLREMAQLSLKIPSLPDEAFSRESLYGEHD
jgi:hypothetical protein